MATSLSQWGIHVATMAHVPRPEKQHAVVIASELDLALHELVDQGPDDRIGGVLRAGIGGVELFDGLIQLPFHVLRQTNEKLRRAGRVLVRHWPSRARRSGGSATRWSPGRHSRALPAR